MNSWLRRTMCSMSPSNQAECCAFAPRARFSLQVMVFSSALLREAVCVCVCVPDITPQSSMPQEGDDKVELCGRGSWWLETLKATPSPGLYHIRDFIEEAELNPVRKTYGFKSVGRRVQPLGVRKGDLLLPGAYDHTDSIKEVLMNQASYSFKNCPRPDIFTLGIRDKHINTSPCDYNVTAKPVEKIPCKHVMFRSTVQRITFPPKEGPAPCHYDPQTRPAKGITSCFRSTLPRLHSVQSTTPGPGAYEPCWKLGDCLNMEDIDPSFSLFFRNTV